MKISFIEILEQNEVVIPIIQRDYAQGRTDSKTTRLRINFLDAIFSMLQAGLTGDPNAVLELDFIYGYRQDGKPHTEFYPIDGQQRLTTLWLLYWFVAVKEGVEEHEKSFIEKFRYETRHSTNQFCRHLIKFKPRFKYGSIAEEIFDQPWYFESWNFDPSVKAMLVMLDDLEKNYAQLPDPLWPLLIRKNNPLMLYMLDMDKVGLADDLYIKMNSRGKALTDFEYFKASFFEIITDDEMRLRFESSIDGEWGAFVWDVIQRTPDRAENVDRALLVDTCFLRLINFITDILAYIAALPFTEINAAPEETKAIYSDRKNLEFLFNALDALTAQHNERPDFWKQHFYSDIKEDFTTDKVRLFFVNKNVNLIENCLFDYEKASRKFSFPEQILLSSCIIQLINNTEHFKRKIRVIRNLVVNSENQLRDSTIRQGLLETHDFILSNNLEVFHYFKSDQIQEEKDKQDFLDHNAYQMDALYRLEDSNLLRGCVSLFDLDGSLVSKSDQFLHLFSDQSTGEELRERADLLLCFGDYSQDDGSLTNMLSARQPDWRKFLTTPGYNKLQLFNKTKQVLMECLDWFGSSSGETVEHMVQTTLNAYVENPMDWKYYFLKYNRFRQNCNKGYYCWKEESGYLLSKMKERQFNGQNWDPFLEEIKSQIDDTAVELKNYRGDLEITISTDLLQVNSEKWGYQVMNMNDGAATNNTFNKLVSEQIINKAGEYQIQQDANGLDIEDRVVKGVSLLNEILALH